MIPLIDIHQLKPTTRSDIAHSGAFFLINKPLRWTSFTLVKRVRHLLRIQKVGHAGTLDPLAEGLMLVAVGRKATKEISQYIKQDKRYIATLHLGEVCESFDLETPPRPYGAYAHLQTEQINDVLATFVGEQAQIPPKFSAIKKEGKRMYDLAREGIEVEMEARTVHLFSIQTIAYNAPELTMDVHCSSGTYIRSLANDIGKKLGCGAYLKHLRRTQIGSFHADNALSWEDIHTHFSDHQKG